MEESQDSGATLATASPKARILAANLGDEAIAPTYISRMISEDLGRKDGEPKWEM